MHPSPGHLGVRLRTAAILACSRLTASGSSFATVRLLRRGLVKAWKSPSRPVKISWRLTGTGPKGLA